MGVDSHPASAENSSRYARFIGNVEAQPRGDGGRLSAAGLAKVEAVSSDDMAGRGGLALFRIAGPTPALCCGDWLNEAAARRRGAGARGGWNGMG
jgi:hypothetical protein